MKATFDPVADAVFIYINDGIPPGGVSKTEYCNIEVSGGPVFLHFDANEKLLGIEILGARSLFSKEVLETTKHI